MRGTRNEHVSTLTAEAKKGTRRTEENRKKRRVSSETTCRVMAEWGSRGPRIPVAPRDYRNDAFFSSLPFVRPFSFLSLFFAFSYSTLSIAAFFLPFSPRHTSQREHYREYRPQIRLLITSFRRCTTHTRVQILL